MGVFLEEGAGRGEKCQHALFGTYSRPERALNICKRLTNKL